MSADQAERHQLGFLLLPLQGAPPDNVSLSLHKKTLRLTDGQEDLHVEGQYQGLLNSISKLVQSRQLSVHAELVVSAQQQAAAKLCIDADPWLWTANWQWKPTSFAASLFYHLHPCTCSDAQAWAVLAAMTSEDFSLASCFAELPAKLQEPVPVEWTQTAGAQTGFADLPQDCMLNIMNRLGPRDLANFSGSCRALRVLSRQAVPGLHLTLYPHQRVALAWMLEREQPQEASISLTWRALVSGQGLPFWVCAATGQFSPVEPARLPVVRGGFFCDEPGLGKTITSLALMSKTLRTLPAAPPDAAVQAQTYNGSKVAAYTEPEGAEERLQDRRVSKRRRSQPERLSDVLSSSAARMNSPIPKRPRVSSGKVKQRKRSKAASDTEDSEPDAGSIDDAGSTDDAGCLDDPIIDTVNWVQCDSCGKWRQLPPGVLTNPSDPVWTCTMHPWASERSCSQAQSPAAFCPITQLAGYVPQAQKGADPANIAHYQKLLADLPPSFLEANSVAHWMAAQDPSMFCKTYQVPHQRRLPPEYHLLLAKLEMQPAEAARRPKHEASGRARRPSLGQHTWQQPARLAGLRLDCAALAAALEKGPEAAGKLTYLSPATLLVVPNTLVPHWLHQMRQHTVPGMLRIAVLTGSFKGKAHQLAWDHDLVIVSFTQLSAMWKAPEKCLLLQVHWLRIILDEGHMLGASLALTNKLALACALRAERRWVMTGTPAPAGGSAPIAHLQPLLAFLNHHPWGSNRAAWHEAVQRPFEEGSPAGRARLLQLLDGCMIRAAKSGLRALPALKRTVTRLKFTPEHARSYNELVEVIERNLLLADWHDEDHVESLLSCRTSKWAKEMLRNVRLSCCVAGNCHLQASDQDVKETLELLAERLKLPTVEAAHSPWVPPGHPLEHVEAAITQGAACQRCRALVRLPIITPCAHVLCLPCAATSRCCCPLPECQVAYQMQEVSDPARRAVNPAPKWAVPIELIEWQAAYTQEGAEGITGGTWSANWVVTKSSKCAYLYQRLLAIGAAQPLHMLGGPARAATKAIVFSQFWMHLELVVHFLATRSVPLALLKRNLSPAEKAAALHRFQNDEACGVLVMDESGSVGLDLSFTSHVFLLEPIPDRSLETQVVARAHRMGAVRTVHVECLVMQDTAEEEVLASRTRAGSTLQASTAPDAAPGSLDRAAGPGLSIPRSPSQLQGGTGPLQDSPGELQAGPGGPSSGTEQLLGSPGQLVGGAGQGTTRKHLVAGRKLDSATSADREQEGDKEQRRARNRVLSALRPVQVEALSQVQAHILV